MGRDRGGDGLLDVVLSGHKLIVRRAIEIERSIIADAEVAAGRQEQISRKREENEKMQSEIDRIREAMKRLGEEMELSRTEMVEAERATQDHRAQLDETRRQLEIQKLHLAQVEVEGAKLWAHITP